MTRVEDARRDRRLIDASASWTDVLGDVRGRELVLLDVTGGRAHERLCAAGARVRVVTTASLGALPAASADAVIFCGLAGSRDQITRAGRVLRSGGELVVVVRNGVSPLQILDGVRARSRRDVTPSAGVFPPLLRRRLAAAGLPPRARYGLLRSLEEPTTFFELDHPRTAAMVLAGSSTRITGTRRQLVLLLRRLLRRRRAELVVPALLLLCSAEPVVRELTLGQVAVRDSYETKLLYGEPVTHMDKNYPDAELAAAEADILEAVDRAWPGLAPKVLERRSSTRTRLSWVTGTTLAVDLLGPEQGRQWVLRAARLLGELQHRFEDSPQGAQTRVHGDFWLGNLLVDEATAAIVGVIDWSDGGWGSAGQDLDFLVGDWVRRAALDESAAAELHESARQQMWAGMQAGSSAPGG